MNESVLNANMIYYNHDLRIQEENTMSNESIQVGLNTTDNVHIVINNVTSNFKTKTHLDLRNLARRGYNTEYKREQGKLIMKLRKPKTTANIWSKGKVICVGCSSEHEARIASRRVARIIQKLGYPEVKFCSYKVTNILATCTLPFPIRIISFAEKYKANTEYEPELNPGVMYRTKEFKATLQIFSSGKISVHAQSEALIRRAVEYIYPLVWPFRREQESNVQPPMTIEEIQAPEQKTESTTGDQGSVYHRPGGEFIGSCQLNTLVL
ncbi:TATA box-binding protein-like protein 1 [Sipha flava]|uniref:TATA box-binding protein-like protein 1 n=2 Tax=Sipha flava TaxID=143950 RepID=A0A8B8F4Z6_9HEMI|nr:TATA box-binding protein-like protein 1 [Sipha flava]XP_025405635.1 TATA box-binding protein-like protein 1 [Sipha flava]